MGMAGFILKNTLSDNGTVTRGVSVVDENGLLSQVHETTGIMMGEDGKIKCDLPDVQEWISPEDKVSMNMWAAYPEFLEFLNNILAAKNSLSCSPRLCTPFWYFKSFWKVI